MFDVLVDNLKFKRVAMGIATSLYIVCDILELGDLMGVVDGKVGMYDNGIFPLC